MNNDINKGQTFQGQNETSQKGKLQEGKDSQPKTVGQTGQYTSAEREQR